MKRFILSLIITPLIVSIMAYAIEIFSSDQTLNMRLFIGMIPIFYVFTSIGLIVIGLPIYYFLKKIKKLNGFNLVILGGLFGVIYMISLTVLFSGKISSFDWTSAFPGFLMGALTAFVFVVIAGIPFFKKQMESSTKNDS